ncbi:MAG TPA: transglycosylase family protein [Acidimicrobiia bacterium]
MTIVTSACVLAVIASVIFAVRANDADATNTLGPSHARLLADVALAHALVPVATPDGVARDPQGRAMSTRYALATRRAQLVEQEAARRHDAEARVATWIAAAAAQAAQVRQVNDAVWDRLAQCETGGNWGLHGARFSGGLGIFNGTWDAFGGREFASNAGSATRDQQIAVAERIRARFGYTGWGCAPHVGLGRTTMN